MSYSDIPIWIICTFIVLFSLAGSITSFIEKESRAGWILLLSSFAVTGFLLVIIYMVPLDHFIRPIFLILSVVVIILFLLPIEGSGKFSYEMPGERYHEADAVLSRRKLIPGTKDYQEYYKEHPEYLDKDDEARKKPGLLSEKSKYYDPGTYCAADASFILTDHLQSLQNISPNSEKIEVDGKKTAGFIEQWLMQTGAHSVGFTELKDYHLYSHKGRGENSGKKIVNDMPHAIAITVEMDHDMMKPAPAGTTVMESAEQYLQSGILASKVSAYIKRLGYNAKAHIDGQYELICPLVAADAGLGMIGRMGLLMTPSLGPRVRIAVITTDIPLEYTSPARHDLTMLDFCKRCKKCAVVCPADAISHDPLKAIDGCKRWRINSEGCYLMWVISGTDCGRCVISCPYAHPDNWFHRLIRWGIKNNLFFRMMAVKLDDVFYGKKPKMKPLPEWVKLN